MRSLPTACHTAAARRARILCLLHGLSMPFPPGCVVASCMAAALAVKSISRTCQFTTLIMALRASWNLASCCRSSSGVGGGGGAARAAAAAAWCSCRPAADAPGSGTELADMAGEAVGLRVAPDECRGPQRVLD